MDMLDTLNMLRLKSDSNCSRAFDFNSFGEKSISKLEKFTFPRFNISVPAISRSDTTLKAINIGTGTSGTRTVNELICCQFSLTAMHWMSSCHNKQPVGYAEVFMAKLILCTLKQGEQNCDSWKILALYGKVLSEVLTTYEFISDFPLGDSFPDFLYFVPNISVIYTVRDPLSWAKSRLLDHGSTPICHPRLWNHPEVRHPFDVIGCIATTRLVHDALIPLSHLSSHKKGAEVQLKHAYLLYNLYNVNLLRARNISAKAICLWDSHSSKPEDLVRIITNHWLWTPHTSSLLGRSPDKKCSKVTYRAPWNKKIEQVLDEIPQNEGGTTSHRYLLTADPRDWNTSSAHQPYQHHVTLAIVVLMISLMCFICRRKY